MRLYHSILVSVFCLLALNGCKKDESVSINRPARFSWLAETYFGREEKPIGTVYARLEGVDEDNDSIFFELVENSSFVINNLTGEITNTVVIDVDDVGGIKYFYLGVSIYDIHGEGEQRSTIIKVGDSTSDNPAPPIEGPLSFSIHENDSSGAGMVATFFNTTNGSWQLQDTTTGVFWLYPMNAPSLNSTSAVSLHVHPALDYETLPNSYTGTLIYTYPASGQQSFLYFTMEVINVLDPY